MKKMMVAEVSRPERKKSLLMAEYNVQVFSDGRMDWGELTNFMRPPLVDRNKLLDRLLAAGPED